MKGVEAGAFYQYKDLRFEGLSLSGIRTAIAMPALGICFDVAQGFPFTLNMKKFFISHGHLDHAAGIPYIISQKSMRQEAAPTFYMPTSLIEPMTEIMKQWEKIEEHHYSYHFRPVTAETIIELNPNYFIRPFRTLHRIESFGYTLFSRVKKLKPEYRQLSGPEIAELRKQNVKINDWIETPQVSFTGDTTSDFLDQAPWIKKSKILFCEATYLDESKSIEHARLWGHTHLDELIPRLGEIESEKIVLIHASSRYSDAMALRLLSERIPPEHRDRVELFPGR